MGTHRQKRLLAAIAVVTVLVAAYFAADGATELVAARVLGGAAPRPAPAATSARTAAARRATSPNAEEMARKLGATPDAGATAPASSPPSAPAGEPGAVGACAGSLRLVAAVVNPGVPDWSFAAITGAAGAARLYRTGMQIDGRDLVGIHEHKVFLRQAGAVCELPMFAGAPRPAATPATPAVPSVAAAPVPTEGEELPGGPVPAGGISSEEMDSNITKVSETQYAINRGLVDKLLENQAEIMRMARIIPHQEGGRTVGIKLYGIRRNGLLGKLGMQNGDMLRTINGYDMSSPDAALEAYARLRSANNLSVQVVRRGQTLNLEYNIQ